MSESGSGSDVVSMKLKAERKGKSFSTSASACRIKKSRLLNKLKITFLL